MSYLLLAAGLLALLWWGSRSRMGGGPWRGGSWRASVGLASIGLIIAAGFLFVRGGGVRALLLGLAALLLAGATRLPRRPQRPASGGGGGMSQEEARAILGVGPGATTQEIQAAYSRLIRLVHPDHGGAVGLAVQLNLARDRLLKGGPPG